MWQKHYFLRITVWSELKFTPKNIHFTRIISVHPWQIACLHGASSHKIDYVGKFWEILNLEGHQNCITCSRVMAILLNGWTLPIGEAASGRVCTCSLCSRLVFIQARIQPLSIVLDVICSAWTTTKAYAHYVDVWRDDYIKDICSPGSYGLKPCVP